MEYGTTGDGLLAGLQLLRIMREKDRPVSEIAGLLTLYPQTLRNVEVREKRPFDQAPEIVAAQEAAEKDLRGRGRVLLRYSGTEALARVMVEGEDAAQVARLADMVADAIRSALR